MLIFPPYALPNPGPPHASGTSATAISRAGSGPNVQQRFLSRRQGASLPARPSSQPAMSGAGSTSRATTSGKGNGGTSCWGSRASVVLSLAPWGHQLRARAGDRDTEPREGRWGSAGLQATGKGAGRLCSAVPARTHAPQSSQCDPPLRQPHGHGARREPQVKEKGARRGRGGHPAGRAA